MECPVCYEIVAEDKRQILECAHFLCQICLSRLCAAQCPLCRAPITTYQVVNIQEPLVLTILPMPTPAVRRRRRRRRRRRQPEERGRVIQTLTQEEILEITEGETLTPIPPVSPIRSTSDRSRQKRRSERNRWKQHRSRSFRAEL